MFEKEAERYIKTHDDYRVFVLDDADIMQIFKDGDYGCILGNKPKDDCGSFELGFSEEG